MSHRANLFYVFVFAGFLFHQLPARAQCTAPGTKVTSPPCCYRAPAFRYIIAYNDLSVDKDTRWITILIDPAAFNEKNLRILFKLLQRKYGKEKFYDAFVFTSMEDIATPEEFEGPSESEGPDNPKGGKTLYASIFHREDSDRLNIFSPSRAAKPVIIDLRIEQKE